jgi:signal transduction histidine kinase
MVRVWTRFWSLAGRVSILVKIMGIVLLVVLALGLAVAWYVQNNVAASLEDELELRGAAIGNGLATHAANYILTDDLFELYAAAQNALKADEDMRYVYIEDADGQVLVHTFDDGFPQDLLDVNQMEGTDPRAVELDTQEGRLVDVAVPILEGEAGTVHVGLSTASASAAIDEHIRFILIATPLVLIPGLALAYVLATVITRALGGVVKAADAVGEGDFGQKAPVWARDEIGRLGVAFNQMAERLRGSHEQLVRRAHELSILNATARATSRFLTLDDVLKAALDNVCELMDVRRGRLCLFGEGGGIVAFTYHFGPPSVLVREVSSSEVMSCPCVEMLAAQSFVEGGAPQGCPIVGRDGPDARSATESGICFPLRAKERLLGVLHLARRDGAAFGEEDVQLLGAVTEQLAVAVENARLWEDLRDREETKGRLLDRVIAAQEEERRRVAQELHDEAGQALTSLLVELRALELGGDREALGAKVSELRGLVAESMRTIQNIALELRPSMLDDMGLVAALRRYMQDYSARHGLQVDFQTSGIEELRLEPAAETAIYRIIQEALTNVARHAEATRVGVLLTRRNADVVAIVEDDGRGFDAGRAMRDREASLGIRGMEERASLVGGRLSLESGREGGATVFVEVPLSGNLREEGGDA